MREISPEEAKENFGILTLHHQMPNGENRFRLKKTDGTAYIRTEIGEGGAWQESHFHKTVKETYIVQVGWIGFATKSDSGFKISVLNAGDQITTTAGVVHNVFMSSHSTIHTVKHGDCSGDDRNTSRETAEFDKLLSVYKNEDDIVRAAIGNAIIPPELTYNAVYRHFDDLIWRSPVWASGIFSITILGLDTTHQTSISNMIGITTQHFTIGFLLLMFFAVFGFSWALFRFRVHQRKARTAERRATPFWKSASTYFQILITFEAFALFGLVLGALAIPPLYAYGCAFLLAAATVCYREIDLRRD